MKFDKSMYRHYGWTVMTANISFGWVFSNPGKLMQISRGISRRELKPVAFLEFQWLSLLSLYCSNKEIGMKEAKNEKSFKKF